MPQLTTSDDIVLIAAAIASMLVLLLGMLERWRHRRRLARVDLRVSVNAIRAPCRPAGRWLQ